MSARCSARAGGRVCARSCSCLRVRTCPPTEAPEVGPPTVLSSWCPLWSGWGPLWSPPATYSVLPTTVPEWPARGDGVEPVVATLAHVLVLKSNTHVLFQNSLWQHDGIVSPGAVRCGGWGVVWCHVEANSDLETNSWLRHSRARAHVLRSSEACCLRIRGTREIAEPSPDVCPTLINMESAPTSKHHNLCTRRRRRHSLSAALSRRHKHRSCTSIATQYTSTVTRICGQHQCTHAAWIYSVGVTVAGYIGSLRYSTAQP